MISFPEEEVYNLPKLRYFGGIFQKYDLDMTLIIYYQFLKITEHLLIALQSTFLTCTRNYLKHTK